MWVFPASMTSSASMGVPPPRTSVSVSPTAFVTGLVESCCPYIGPPPSRQNIPETYWRWNHDPRALRSLASDGKLAAGGGAMAGGAALYRRLSRIAHPSDGCV